MGSNNISLTPNGWAHTNSWYPTTNYSLSNPIEISGASNSLHGESKVILQFDIPSSISGSKINSAVLNFDMQALWDSSQIPQTDHTISTAVYYSSAITSGYVFSTVTHNNYSSLITQGTKTKIKVLSGEQHFYSNQIDITSVVANNIKNGILTIILEGVIGQQQQKINPNSISLGLVYEEVEAVTPLVVAPNGTYENRSNNIKFEWIYKSQTEATQASATLEYRKGSSGSYTAVNVYNSNNYYTIPANTLTAGVCEWRVKTTDTDGKTSDYAYGSFTVIDRPSVPIVTNIENKCISTITWSSAEQIAYEFEAYKGDELVYSKRISSSDNNYKPNMFFANDTYTVKIRVCNIYGLWSEWGSKIFTFTFTNPSTPSILVTQGNAVITIKTDTASSILYKSSDNGESYIPIYKFDDKKEFVDYKVASNKIYKYFVRKYENGYTDSKIQIAQVSIKGLMLQNDNEAVNGKLSNDIYMAYNESLYSEKSLNNYVGREYYVIEFGEHKGRTLDRNFLLNKSNYEALKKLFMSNTILTYRDSFGNMFPCVIDMRGENALMNTMYSVSVTITQVDETEEISIYE